MDRNNVLPIHTLVLRLRSMRVGWGNKPEIQRIDLTRYLGRSRKAINLVCYGHSPMSPQLQRELSSFFLLLDRGLIEKRKVDGKWILVRVAETAEEAKPRPRVDFSAGKIDWQR